MSILKGLAVSALFFLSIQAFAQVQDFKISPVLGDTEEVKSFRVPEDGKRVYVIVGPKNTENTRFSAEKLYVASSQRQETPRLLNSSASTRGKEVIFGSESSDGSVVAFYSKSGDFFDAYRVDSNGENEVLIRAKAADSYIPAPPVFLDNNSVLLSAPVDPPNTGTGVYLKTFSPDSEPKRLDETGLGFDGFKISKDRKYVVYVTREIRSEPSTTFSTFFSTLYSINLSSGDVTRLTQREILVSFETSSDNFEISPDGKKVVYRVIDPETWQIDLFSVSIDGSKPTKLNRGVDLGTLSQRPFIAPFFITPDSSKVVSSTNPLLGRDELYAFPITGGEPIKISNHPAISTKARIRSIKSVDNDSVVYPRDDFSGSANTDILLKASLDGSTQEKILSRNVDGLLIRNMILGPDHNFIAFKETQTTGNILRRPSDIQIINLKTNKKTTYSDSDFESTHLYGFSNNGDFVIATGRLGSEPINTPSELYALPVKGGDLIKLSREFTNTISNDHSLGVSWVIIPAVGNRVIYSANYGNSKSSDELFSAKLPDPREICAPVKNKNSGVSIICF